MPTNITLLICRWVLSFIWLYQGLVPKWLGPHRDELAMNMALGLSHEQAVHLAYVGGSLEIILGLLLFSYYRRAWPYRITILVMLGLSAFALLFAPQLVVSAFNAITINVAMSALAVIALIQLQPVSRQQ
jgi:hypothetical protein